jgi:MFS family permease
MRSPFTLFFGIFSVMALSNAIVPVLPAFSGQSSLEGAIYAAYFLGAFISTLPAGILSDRYGRIPLMRLGLAITVASGLFLSVTLSPVPVLALRLLEGVGAGIFVASAMSYVNSTEEHGKMSGYFMALLNAGLVLGLVCSGWLAEILHSPSAGILLFAVLSLIPAVTVFLVQESPLKVKACDTAGLFTLVREQRWLWYSSIVLIGITGVVSSLYPKFSGASSDILGYWIAGMSVATIVAVLAASRLTLPEAAAIRWSALLMAAGVMASFYTPAGFLILGALAGFVMIAQMAVLADLKDHQGIAMGLFSTAGYLGMALLPFLAGLVADSAGFFLAFIATALCAITVAGTIGR